MKKSTLLSFIILTSSHMIAQYAGHVSHPDTTQAISTDSNDVAIQLANTITVEDMKKHLYTLADDNMQGRETGHPGNEKAAQYISKFFGSLDLPTIGDDDSYFQNVSFTFSRWDSTKLVVNDTSFRNMWDYLSFPGSNQNMPDLHTDEIVFLGYGIDDQHYNDYRKKNVKNKVIMIHSGEPMKSDSTYWVTGTKTPSMWSNNIENKLKVAKRHGVKLVLVIEKDIQQFLSKNRRRILGAHVTLGDRTKEKTQLANSIHISPLIAKKIIDNSGSKIIKARQKANQDGKATNVRLKSKFTSGQYLNQKVLLGKNILAYIEGTDKREEVVVVSAHYDHIGMRGDDVFNGADDNASGTTTVMEIAEALAHGKKNGISPRRSVLCLLVTGEEKGLLGSDYYSSNPLFTIENTVANVNIDMVGRVTPDYEGKPEYIYVIGSDRLSTDLHNINEAMNQKYTQITLDYKYNDADDPNRFYYRSDHYNFAKHGIPSIFFFNGTHEDYHGIGDTADKIQFEKMNKIGKLAFHTLWELANRKDRIVVDGEVK